MVKLPSTHTFTTKGFCKAQNLQTLRGLPLPQDLSESEGAGDSHAFKQIDPGRPLQEMCLSWLRMEDGESASTWTARLVTGWLWGLERGGAEGHGEPEMELPLTAPGEERLRLRQDLKGLYFLAQGGIRAVPPLP